MTGVEALQDALLARLLWTSLQTGVLVAIIALVQWVVPRLHPAARCLLWWLVAAQVIVGLACYMPIRLPVLPFPTSATVTSADQVQAGLTAVTDVTHGGEIITPSVKHEVVSKRISWREALLLLWVIGLAVQIPFVTAEWRRIRALCRDARPAGPQLRQRCANLAQCAKLRRTPELRVSDAVETPFVTGWWRPLIVWPAEPNLTVREASLVLAHELAHVKRGDLWMGVVLSMAQRLLYFHPLMYWAVREYAVNREAACDANAVKMHEGPASRDFGQMLLHLGVPDHRPVALAGASLTYRGLRRRLVMLQVSDAHAPKALAWAIATLIAIAGVLPYRVVASDRPVPVVEASGRSPSEAAPSATAPPQDDTSGITVCCGHWQVDFGPLRESLGLVLFDDGNVIIHGTAEDVAAAKPLYGEDASLLWFRRDGGTYVIRDTATIRRLETEYAPTLDLLGQLSKLQKKLGTLTAELGSISFQQGGLSREQAQTAYQLSMLPESASAAVASREDLEQRLKEVTAKKQELKRRYQDLEARHAALEERVEAADERFERKQKELKASVAAVLNRIAIQDAIRNPASTRL